MTYYAVVVREEHSLGFCYYGREPFITSSLHIAEKHKAFCEKNWPNVAYQIVSFDVEI